jgi:trk system potassium uptake protein TrkH
LIRPAVVGSYIGKILIIIGIAMISSALWSWYYSEDVVYKILVAALITIASGLLLTFFSERNIELNYREGFAVVTFGWIAACIFAALPFWLSGCFPSFTDAFFEAVSGVTTTGATVLSNIEAMPRGILFWRSLTQWLGGMGIMVLFIALITVMGSRANQIFRAEGAGGAVKGKISPRIKETAKIFWKAYMVLSGLLLLLLYLFGMDLFDALCHTFSTMATGGFSTKNQSIGYYSSPAIQWIIILFMFIAGTNFSLHYLAFKNRSLKNYVRNREFVLYGCIVLAASLLVLLGLAQIDAVEEKIRSSLFQVVSIITTTGFSTTDYGQWSPVSAGVLFILLFVGASAGSTSGNVKVGRYQIMLGRTIIETKKMVHPKALIPQRYGDRLINENLVINVLQYFFLHMMLVFSGAIIIGLLGVDLLTAISAAAACMGNVGPGFAGVGPAQNYALIPAAGKCILSVLMIFGRLEIYPIIVMMTSDFWKD